MGEPEDPEWRPGCAGMAPTDEEVEAEATRIEAEHRAAIASIGLNVWRALNRLANARVVRWKTGLDERDALKLIFRHEAERRARAKA